MKKIEKLVCFVFFALLTFGFSAQASFLEVVNTIHATGNAINSVNRATRGTLSTVEYGQRFQDRQQDRQDYKRAQKSYNADMQDEYYRTLQETRMLEQQYNSGAALRVDL